MKLLWWGDLSETGFGTVTSDVGRAFVDLGVDVRFVSQNELGNLPEPFASRTLDLTTFNHVQAGPGDLHGGVDPMHLPGFIGDVLQGNAAELKLANGEDWGTWKPDATMVLGDFYGVRLIVGSHVEAFRSLPSFHYVPIEGHDLPPEWAQMWGVIKPIAMTRFGQAEIAKVVGYEPPMVYHGVDTSVFRPVSATEPIVMQTTMTRSVLNSKEACKRFFGLNPAVRLVLRTDRNMPRKGYPALLRAMEPVMAERPDVVLALHCRSFDQGGYLPDAISKMRPGVRERVFVPDWGPLPREALVALYNAADLYVSVSAEGFGLTIAESLACGVPAVGLDYSAVPEVIGPCGSVVPVGRILDNEYAHHWALPDEAEFGRSVAYLLDKPHKRLELGRMGPAHVSRNFRWDVAAERFTAIAEKALEGVVPEAGIEPAPPAPSTRRSTAELPRHEPSVPMGVAA